MGSAVALSMLLLNVLIARATAQVIYGTYWFNDAQKRRMIQIHNQLRAIEPASNMQELVWDDRLAALAHGHVQRCDAWHRSAYERRGYGYFYIGENIWWSNEEFLRSNLESIVIDFYNEKPWYDFSSTGCYGPQCGHYTQVTWATTCAVGCAAVHCNGIKNGRGIYRGHIIVCNYGEGGNMHGQQPYLVGPRCSQCIGCGGCTSDGLCQSRCYGTRFPRFYQRPQQFQRFNNGRRFQPFNNRINNNRETSNWHMNVANSKANKFGATQKQNNKQTGIRQNVCMDNRRECAQWAKMGRCRDSNREFMAQQCRRSCRLCTAN